MSVLLLHWTLILAVTTCLAAALFFLSLWLRSKNKLAASIAKFNIQLETLDQTILQAKKQLEATFDSIADGIAVIDTNYNITRLNRTYADFAAKTITSVLGRKCYSSLRGREEPCQECPITNMNYYDGFSCRIREKKIQIEVKPAMSAGIVQNYIETVRNVTRFENLHSQLRRSERMAAIGTMVAGITHEMNNPLSGISGNAQLMLRTPVKYGLNKKGLSRIQTIVNSSERATNIVNELLDFATFSQANFKALRLKDLFKTALTETQKAGVPKYQVYWDFPADNLKVMGNRKQLENVLAKILLNAFQAIQIEENLHPQVKGRIELAGKMVGNNIIGTITDNGCGISEEDYSNIFDPFYTTKDPGVGVGLGLSICHRIMTEHQGSITVLRMSQGTQVQLNFAKEKSKIV